MYNERSKVRVCIQRVRRKNVDKDEVVCTTKCPKVRVYVQRTRRKKTLRKM